MHGETPPAGYEAFDQLATMVAIARSDGHCLLANSTLENAVAVSPGGAERAYRDDYYDGTYKYL